MATSHALDRLARPEISSVIVKDALKGWSEVAGRSRADLAEAYNDYTEIIGPIHRDDLEHAVRALPRQLAAPLRAAVERADEAFWTKTLPDHRADPGQPWWWRRGGC